jgi:hypothetical protein
MPPDRRRSPTRGVLATEAPALLLRGPIALDTSFVVEALIRYPTAVSTWADFPAHIVEASVSVVNNDLLRIELIEAAFSESL